MAGSNQYKQSATAEVGGGPQQQSLTCVQNPGFISPRPVPPSSAKQVARLQNEPSHPAGRARPSHADQTNGALVGIGSGLVQNAQSLQNTHSLQNTPSPAYGPAGHKGRSLTNSVRSNGPRKTSVSVFDRSKSNPADADVDQLRLRMRQQGLPRASQESQGYTR